LRIRLLPDGSAEIRSISRASTVLGRDFVAWTVAVGGAILYRTQDSAIAGARRLGKLSPTSIDDGER
jgi:hypothetical protein